MKWILYDIGGVLELVDDHTWPQQLEQAWSDRLGLPVDVFRARLDGADLPDTTLQSGVATEYWQKLGAALEIEDAEVDSMRAQLWDAYCGEANTELLEHARSLKGRAGLAILSNSGDGAREEEERRFRFSEVFDPICYSHEQGVAKPDPGAYLAALARMGASAADVLFIDDNEGPMRGAESCGIRAVLHRDNTATIAAIEAFLAE
ncbi:HAD-IA family hydrolase [Microbacterium sp. NPDC077644]|uniref:HAD-IA family hydrolase n=1 Tax=Microbacterium sp. NPDC077644 TaxID=3155055 RepID=UPI00344C88F5